MRDIKDIKAPFLDEEIETLNAGDVALISGVIYTGRDAAHKRMVEMLERDEDMPFDFSGQAIYYAGPSPSPPGYVIGSIGPTTSGRMDAYTPILMEKGLKVMIGKGRRDQQVIESIVKHKGVYFAAIGGAAALMSKCVKSAEIVAFEDLGTEAIRKLTVEKLPVIVVVDSKGNNAYKI